MSSSRQRAEKRIHDRVITWALTDSVYEALGGTPSEDVLEGLPNLDDIRAEIERGTPPEDLRERHELVRQKLASRQEVINARNARNAARYPIMRLAQQVARYVVLEERQAQPVELNTFVRDRIARATLDRAASQLGLSREAMWQRFTAAVAAAKERERWRRYPEVLDQALRAIDWEQLATEERERRSRFPKSQKRWSPADDQQLRTSFQRLWDEGIEPPIHGAETGNELLARLSDEFGRTPGAIWQRLVRQKLASAVPGETRRLFARRQQEKAGAPIDEHPTTTVLRDNALLDRRRAELSDALRRFVVERSDFLVVMSDQERSYYVQFGRLWREGGSPAGFVYGEAVSNAHLQEADRLSPRRLELLRQLGWYAPEEKARMSPPLKEPIETDNWWQLFFFENDDDHSPYFRDRIASVTLETLARVYEYDGRELVIESGSFAEP